MFERLLPGLPGLREASKLTAVVYYSKKLRMKAQGRGVWGRAREPHRASRRPHAVELCTRCSLLPPGLCDHARGPLPPGTLA